MHGARDEHALTSGGVDRHDHRFGERGRAVVDRCVRDVEPGQQADVGLPLVDRLQVPLGDLGLVGGVRGQELAAQKQLIDAGGHMMAIGAGPAEERPGASGAVLRRQGAQRPLHRQFAGMSGQVHRTGKAVAAVRPKDEAEAAVHALHLRKISASLSRA